MSYRTFLMGVDEGKRAQTVLRQNNHHILVILGDHKSALFCKLYLWHLFELSLKDLPTWPLY